MSLPEQPLTRRETFLAKAAGQDVTLPEEDLTREELYLRAIANGGGGGGTSDYTYLSNKPQINGVELSGNKTSAALGLASAEDVSAIQAIIPDSATEQNKLATLADVTGEDIAATATGTAITVTDSADARVQALTVKGRTANGASVGDNGLEINSHGKNFFNINGEVNYNAVNATTPPENWAIDTSSLKSTVSGTTITAKKNAQYYFLNGQKINVIAGETYTLSFRMLESEVGGVARVSYWDETEQKNKHAVNWWKSNIFTTQHITFTAPANLILLCFGTGASTPVSFTDIQLEKGAEYTEWGAYKGSTITITTGLPLRSASESVYDELDCAAGTVTTRCEVVEGEVVPLTTPFVTPLSSTELAAYRALRTYDSLTHIAATDDPQMTVSYLKNTDNGRALAAVQDENTSFDATATLAAASWAGNSAPYTQTVSVEGIRATDRPIIDVSVSSTVATGIDEITQFGYISKAETGAGTITFSCYENKPNIDLTINIKVVR